jgi:hypothetical protein
MPKFDDHTIELIFGADDAENEDPKRFVEYFYYNRAYERAGPGCLNRRSASISGASAGVRPPSGMAVG